MAAITVDGCRKVLVNQADQITGPAAEDIVAGSPVVVDNASGGRIALHGGTEVGIMGIALTNANAGMECTVVIRGVVDIGDGLDALDYNAPVYAGDGALDDAAGVTLGYVWPGYASTTPDKLLWLTGNGEGTVV